MTYPQIKKIIAETQLPPALDLTPHGHIFDLPKFVASHMAVLDGNSGNPAYLPYYDRLKLVAIKLQDQ